MIQAVIFDLDGTLINTIDSMAEAGNEMLALRGLPAQPAEDYRYFAGDGAQMLTLRALKAAGDPNPNLSLLEAFDQYMAAFARTCTHNIHPYNGILDVLEELALRDIRTAVLSNKPHQQVMDVVRAAFGSDVFDVVQGQTPDIPPKPDQAGIRMILNRLGFDPEDCLYVGDTNVDMQTGRAAGIKTVGVLWGFRDEKELRDNRADCIISQPQELLSLL